MTNSFATPSETLRPPEIGHGGYQGFNPRSEVLRKGEKPFGARALPCDILVAHDVSITMRDGIRLYADIYRPSKVSIKVPIVLSWSPFGKKFNGIDCLKLITPTP
jgi:predicted acyl esterase